ncbi:MAG: hypothetical protein VW338_00830 [Rhodospirillaceae bacterium]
MSLTTILRAAVVATLIGAADLGTNKHEIAAEADVKLPSGTSSGRADLLFADERSINASSSENLDLTGGSLEDGTGAALVFAKVKAILIHADDGNTNNVVVGNAAANPFVGPFDDGTATVAIPPGGFLFLAAPAGGWTVSTDSADILKVANSGAGTAVTYRIYIIGTSA